MKKLMKIAFVVAFAAVAGYGVYASQKSEALSDLALANVEALADNESSGGGTCYSTYKSADWFHSDYTFTYCYSCSPKKGHDLMDRGNC